MATDQLSIVNRALLQIGARAQVSNISPSDGSTEADVAAVLFTPTFEALARSAHWNCLRKQRPLAVLAAAAGTPENAVGTGPIPPQPWQYSYALPPDCLNMRFLLPNLLPATPGAQQTTLNNAAPLYMRSGGEQIPFAVAYDEDATRNPIQVVLTNQIQAIAVYTVDQQNPAIWDSQFQAAMVASLAAYFVPALSLHMGLMQSAMQAAERIIAQARLADGNEGVTVLDHTPDWFRARSGGRDYSGSVMQCATYSNMSWPVT